MFVVLSHIQPNKFETVSKLIYQAIKERFAYMNKHRPVRNYFYKSNEWIINTRKKNPKVNSLGNSLPTLTNRTKENVSLCALEHIKLEKRNKQWARETKKKKTY